MDAIFQVMDDWEAATDEKETVHAVFFDFAKAFELVNHEILMKKMEKYLPDWITSWIAQYLTKRTQRVKCNGSYSVWEAVSWTNSIPSFYYRPERLTAGKCKAIQIRRRSTDIHFIQKYPRRQHPNGYRRG